ncbi:short-chain-enoyl-CoA hydratase [Candidatus Phycosocius bacilliformis]|uniref:3-hydroxyisobutyryl-CoA hydrolase n=1 Tax=Candidatus Phycosocius bacilliformis TaxID=1445552 RepID=A0A2P2E830_9PROT|nr:enoyl-CoA hydratase/isomerase family protein [Candidatus Phycosocius bacilliformis]GBF57222.1 short-chain-enoyl-CoA hydratase [Candidatus Phycosocius bacilliformis]
MSETQSKPVIVSRQGGLGVLTLNRPEALHALNQDMVEDMIAALLSWIADPEIKGVMVDHVGSRGFCAGGDIRMLAESGAGDGKQAQAFFGREYQLNHLIAHYPKPYVAVMDGITMGGGVGISVHGPFRIGTERTVFAMPETGIGLFPDVGGGWFLPRLPGQIGLWLALTGTRLKAADCLAAGILTHFIPEDLLVAAKAQIAGAMATHTPIATLTSGLDALSEPAGRLHHLVPEHRAIIDRCFAANSVEAIIAALEDVDHDFAREQLAILATKSPQTLKVAFRQLRQGALATDFAAHMRQEYRIGSRVVRRHDFIEGVRAVLIDKDHAPRWQPETLNGVDEALLNAIFAPLSPAEGAEWEPLTW